MVLRKTTDKQIFHLKTNKTKNLNKGDKVSTSLITRPSIV